MPVGEGMDGWVVWERKKGRAAGMRRAEGKGDEGRRRERVGLRHPVAVEVLMVLR